MIYAYAYILGLFAVPVGILAGTQMIADRVRLTRRGLNVLFAAMFAALILMAIVWGVVLPAPMSAV